jgi:SOS response regulatory protein OraA/RecX
MIDRAIQCLSNKSYSEKELRELLESEFREELDINKNINKVIDYLLAHSLINDNRLAQELTRYYDHKGNNFIRHLLEQRKIKKAVIDETLSLIPAEIIRAWEETQKKLFSLRNISKSEQLSLVRRFLMGRQFSLTAINQIIARLSCAKPYQLNVIPFNVRKKYALEVA